MTSDAREDGEFWPGEYRFCPMCQASLEPAVRAGRHRMTCPVCGWIHFRDPAVGAAVVVVDSVGRLLLVRRGPGATQSGKWCIPAGYVDYGEEIREAAARELREETGLESAVGDVLQVMSNFHDPAKLSVGIWFSGRITGGSLRPGDDAVDAGWFAFDDLPELAFETDRALVKRLRTGSA